MNFFSVVTKLRNSTHGLDRTLRLLSQVTKSIPLRQDSSDTEQLKPIQRFRSIQKVWNTQSKYLKNPKTAIDAGSGFGYGTIFLDSLGIAVVGVENIQHKITQGISLFSAVGISSTQTSCIDLSQSPAFICSDIENVPPDTEKVDLITMFYLSKQVAINPNVIKKCRSLLKENGQILMSTEASFEKVRQILEKTPIQNASVLINKIPNNFERVAIIVEFT